MIDAGRLDTRVAFSKRGAPPASATDFGSPLGDWERLVECWAGVMHLRGSEPVVQSRLEGRQPVVVTVRRSSMTLAVTEDWRAELGHGCECRAYNIVAVTPHDDKTGIDFLCVYGGAIG